MAKAHADMIEHTWPDRYIMVEEGALRFFAKATGESNPIYSDVESARAAGHRALPVPPTYLFSLELMAPADSFWLEDLGVDLAKVLHAEQSFEHDRIVYAGERLCISARITDAYEKKDGMLQFMTRDIAVHGEDGTRAALLRTTLVVRHG